jgi:NAD(P)-dependent dehydrogenase (short-subunit alcohol dehydrogenase family)
VGEPPDIANLATFLASDQSSYITGEVFCISGGMYMKS